MSIGGVTGGSAIPSAPTGADTSTQYPLWLQQDTYNLANAAANLSNSPYTTFPGPQVAAPSAATKQAEQMALSNVGSYQPSLAAAGALTSANAAPITGNQIMSYMNPFESTVIGGLQSAANTNLMQNVLPSIQDRFVSSGQSRSPQEMQATNNALYQSQQALDQATSGALQTGYQGALNAATTEQGMGLAGGAQTAQLGALGSQLGAADVGQVAAAGQQQDINAQANINSAMNNFFAQQQWPYQNLAFASNILRGQPIASNTMAVGMLPPNQSQYTASPLSSFIGTTLGAQSLGSGAGGMAGGTAGGSTSAASLGVSGGRRGGRVRKAGALAHSGARRDWMKSGALSIISAA